jgi:hypothetical protein
MARRTISFFKWSMFRERRFYREQRFAIVTFATDLLFACIQKRFMSRRVRLVAALARLLLERRMDIPELQFLLLIRMT